MRVGRTKTVLTPEQRDLVDATVLGVIREEKEARAGDIVVRVGPVLERRVPAHPDGFYRHVDLALQRLRAEGRIELAPGRWWIIAGGR